MSETKSHSFADVLQILHDKPPLESLTLFFNARIITLDKDMAELYATLRKGKKTPEELEERVRLYGALATLLRETKISTQTSKRFITLYLEYLSFCVVAGKVAELNAQSGRPAPEQTSEPPAPDVQQPAERTSSTEEKAKSEEEQCPTPPPPPQESDSNASDTHGGAGTVAPRRSSRVRAARK